MEFQSPACILRFRQRQHSLCSVVAPDCGQERPYNACPVPEWLAFHGPEAGFSFSLQFSLSAIVDR